MDKKSITLLGSTGSIGVQALEVAAFHGMNIEALCFGSNIKLGEAQVRKFSPRFCAVFDEKAALDLKTRIADTETEIFCGTDGICEMTEAAGSDICLNAISGFAGLLPTMSAVKSCRRIALANKETLVAAGDIVMGAAKEHGCEIVPIDSEHSAIFQCLQAGKRDEVKRLILTCSGGAFFGYTKEKLATVTREQALGHPTWNMGAKITIDCATLMNKGLELIEAMHLFSVPASKTDIVIHRESIIHSMVEYIDNTVMAQLGSHDMRLPIQYALTYPDRAEAAGERLDLVGLGRLSFFSPDYETFPLLGLAWRMAEAGGNMPCVMNAANEEAVGLFLSGRILFSEIPELVMRVCEETARIEKPSLSDIIEENMRARALTANYAASR
ncbi:1-deoxy-D-xylulose 5-phosphate reductoisomerase [Candidatus Apopatosoma intestinale]|nr:1-deoxy-D-xylulose 5-phosphate reductoisomerase [Candidatus Apopatosoma intestinale]